MHTPTAVITGAAGGLGQEIARQLLTAGFAVIALTRSANPLGRTTCELHADLVDRDDVRALPQRLRDTVDHVDVLVNNAGAAFAHYAETADGVERTHALNHLAPFHLTHLLLAGGLLSPAAGPHPGAARHRSGRPTPERRLLRQGHQRRPTVAGS